MMAYMPRLSSAVAIDLPHHIIRRGNYRHSVFEEDGEYLRNHVHFIAVPGKRPRRTEGFVLQLEQLLGRILSPVPRGRPRKPMN